MSEPEDAPYNPRAGREYDAEVKIICDDAAETPKRNCLHKHPITFTFRRIVDEGEWVLLGARDTANPDDLVRRGGDRAVGGMYAMSEAWRLWCPGCTRDARFGRSQLSEMLDALAAVGKREFPLALLELQHNTRPRSRRR
ncbi:hypothetical protein [Amycolatopsis sp. lyj-346]|uniref:hypothetical protein n=1 Tax=Amycolatopsis sp. lyj-346 TaxID=2789289 RepID=UPI003978A05C